MNISDIKIRLIGGNGKLRAAATMTIDNCFAVHDIKIIDGANGPFIVMPGRKTSDGKFKDVAHPLDAATRKIILSSVMRAYLSVLEKQASPL